MFAFIFASACQAPPQEDPADEQETASSAQGQDPTALRLRPSRPEYTPAELDALSQTPAVKSLNNPYGDAPPPTRSLYVQMSDGTRLALSLYFPSGFDEAVGRAPVVYVETWYGRSIEPTGTAIDLYRAGGFVVAIGEPRGFGASFGAQPSYLSNDVRRDQKEMIAWLAAQPWSNGKVAAVGLSISSTQAEAMAASGAPALRAAIIRASDFDLFAGDLFPGGIPNPKMLGLVDWLSTFILGEPCIADLAVCATLGIAPVDGDTDLRLLQAALRDHQANLRGGDLANIVYKDDKLGAGYFDEVSAAGSIPALRRAAVPARVSASWTDGTTAEGALARFQALPDVKMEVVIGATAHSGGLDADPFSRTPFGPARPTAAVQYGEDVSFVKRVLAGEPIGRSVRYYVMGAGVWKTTEHWPPAGVRPQTLKLSRDELVAGDVRPGQRTYQVDPTTSSGGPFNRWGSQGGEPIYYGDRRAAPGSRLTFDTAPLPRDSEIVGTPELCLAMRSNQTDGTLFAYLEDVAPDGRVTHLTEGLLRLIHRKTASGGCDPAAGTQRSFKRADAAPVVPGELMQVELSLLPMAALIERGHRLRLSITGADAGTFPPVTETPGTWVVATGGPAASTVTVPLRPWSR
jgi:putative CocE/NonD family hydrolase